jgi:prepilin-type N-terminal cleavage/methylation domain-containing protein
MRGSRKESGFSLLEVMIALVVLSVGLLALVGMFGSGFTSLETGNRTTRASQLAKRKMDALRVVTPFPILNEEDSLEGMKRRWSIRKSEGDPNIWVISVEVLWKNSQDRDRRIFIKSLKFF